MCGKEGFKVNCQFFCHMILNCGLQQQFGWNIVIFEISATSSGAAFALNIADRSATATSISLLLNLLDILEFVGYYYYCCCKIHRFKTLMPWLRTQQNWFFNFLDNVLAHDHTNYNIHLDKFISLNLELQYHNICFWIKCFTELTFDVFEKQLKVLLIIWSICHPSSQGMAFK